MLPILIASLIVSLSHHQSFADACLTTTNELNYKESRLNSTDQRRVYNFCPGTVINVGHLDFNNDLVGGLEMIQLRPNLTIQCGDQGLREDNCRVIGGSVLVDGTHHFGLFGIHGPLANILLKGLTFVGARKHFVWVTKPGMVTFEDCVFRAGGPILGDYSPASLHPGPRVHLSLIFRGCLFEENRYRNKGNPAVVVGNGSRNRIIIQKSFFSGNDMVSNNSLATTNSFLVSTSGPLTLSQNCFHHNSVGVSPIAVYGASIPLMTGNFLSDGAASLVCPFLSHFAVGSDVDSMTPTCFDFDAEMCQADWTNAPSTAPSTVPSFSPSMLASSSPSSYPTLEPSSIPSLSPTSAPTEFPSLRAATTSPSFEPSPRPRRTFSPAGEPKRFPGRSPGSSTSGARRFHTFGFATILFWLAGLL